MFPVREPLVGQSLCYVHPLVLIKYEKLLYEVSGPMVNMLPKGTTVQKVELALDGILEDLVFCELWIRINGEWGPAKKECNGDGTYGPHVHCSGISLSLGD